jgi:hypothetical protein
MQGDMTIKRLAELALASWFLALAKIEGISEEMGTGSL